MTTRDAPMVITWRVLEIWERPLYCEARRGKRSKVWCESPALHEPCWGHVGRGRIGQWFFWK